MLKLNENLKEINLWATWFDGSKSPEKISIKKALEELDDGRAKVIASDTILLTRKKKSIRELVLKRDNQACYFCGEFGNTIEYLIPKSKGGKKVVGNCVCSCKACSRDKGDKTEKEYWRYLIDSYVKEQEDKKVAREEVFS